MSRLKIIILLHRNDHSFYSLPYLIHLLIEEWRSMGHVTEMTVGTERFAVGDILIPHIDLTVLPADYVDLFARYPVVINRALIDISKSRISSALVRRGEPYEGRVVVKTDRNSGGMPERYLCSENQPRACAWPGARNRHIASVVRKFSGWRHVETLSEYPVFDSVHEVPDAIFENPHLVVEKFLPEKDGNRFCLRHYSFFATQAVNRLSRSNHAIVKGANLFQSEDLPAPDADLENYRGRLGMDFGRFDYVRHAGKPMVFDVNRTPTYDPADPFFRRTSRQLARGLQSVLAL